MQSIMRLVRGAERRSHGTALCLHLAILLAPLLAGALSAGERWPVLIDLKQGQPQEVRVTGPAGEIERSVRLLGLEEHSWPDWFIPEAADHRTLRSVEVQIEVGGTRATLWARPFEPPQLINGLRFYVETTRNWATTPQLDPLPGVDGQVRLSCVAEGATWGSPALRFPIRQYRWQANTYRNTWCALVPYNKLYYHRGEDFGAIPDELEVLASLGGSLGRSPLPQGDGDSNCLKVDGASGVEVTYYHMDLETILPGLVAGAKVAAGQSLGRTGMTWDGRRSQGNDPHLHWGIARDGRSLGSYPFLLEAYLRDYPDPVLAVAGGYHYAVPGRTVELDGSRSVARPGRRVVRHQWRLHDGREVEGPRATVRADKPGLYSEELRVWTEDGSEDRDYAQLRVWDAQRGPRIGAGWFYHSPIRDAHAGSPVRFWNRLWNTTGPISIDFGDGSPVTTINRELEHSYAAPGIFTARLQGRGQGDEPLEVKMRVVIER